MIVKKLDRRFRLYKTGQAQFYVDVSIDDFHNFVDARLTEAFGRPIRFYKGHARCRISNADWYYSLEKVRVEKEFRAVCQTFNIFKVDCYRLYFRREEQVSYLTLLMS